MEKFAGKNDTFNMYKNPQIWPYNTEPNKLMEKQNKITGNKKRN